MKIFLDTANSSEIKEAVKWGVVNGVTTNPSLVAREKGDFHDMVKEICALVKGPVSAEVLSLEAHGMIKEAKELAAIAANVVIKLPVTPAGLTALQELKKEGIKTNLTLVFSLNQALLVAGAGGSYVSPFVGRLDDCGHEGMELVKDIVHVYNNYDLKTEVIAASIRHPLHVIEAAKAGAHVVTLPFKVLKQMFEHPLTDKGIDSFIKDWENKQ